MTPSTRTAHPSSPRAGTQARMAKIEAIVDPSKLEELKAELAPRATAFGWTGVSCYSDRQVTATYRGVAYLVDSVPMVKLEILAYASAAPQLVGAIERIVGSSARGGQVLTIAPLEELVQVRSRAAGSRWTHAPERDAG
jgi:nitrogen regulatory protein P-II 1